MIASASFAQAAREALREAKSNSVLQVMVEEMQSRGRYAFAVTLANFDCQKKCSALSEK